MDAESRSSCIIPVNIFGSVESLIDDPVSAVFNGYFELVYYHYKLELMMKNLLTFGLAVWFLFIFLGCAHTPDSKSGMAKQQESTTVQTNRTPQEIAAAQPTGPPAVEIPETVFDFGRVGAGPEYLHTFKIRNTGTGVLEIKKVVPC